MDWLSVIKGIADRPGQVFDYISRWDGSGLVPLTLAFALALASRAGQVYPDKIVVWADRFTRRRSSPVDESLERLYRGKAPLSLVRVVSLLASDAIKSLRSRGLGSSVLGALAESLSNSKLIGKVCSSTPLSVELRHPMRRDSRWEVKAPLTGAWPGSMLRSSSCESALHEPPINTSIAYYLVLTAWAFIPAEVFLWEDVYINLEPGHGSHGDCTLEPKPTTVGLHVSHGIYTTTRNEITSVIQVRAKDITFTASRGCFLSDVH